MEDHGGHRVPWITLGVLGLAFYAALTAPDGWERLARRYPLPAGRPIVATAAPVLCAVAGDESMEPAARPPLEPSAAQRQPADDTETPARMETAGPVGQRYQQPRHQQPLPAEVLLPAEALLPRREEPLPVLEPPALNAQPAEEEAESQPDESAFTEHQAPVAAPGEPVTGAGAVWPLAISLLDRIAQCAAQTGTGDLGHLENLLHELAAQPELHTAQVGDLLRELRQWTEHLEDRAQTAAPEHATPLRRLRHALVRRVDLWQAVYESGEPMWCDQPPSPAELQRRLSEVEPLLESTGAAGAWREYLCLDRLQALAEAGLEPANLLAARGTARRVLRRIHAEQADPQQRQFLAQRALQRLDEALRPWASGPVRAVELLHAVERYEQALDDPAARPVAERFQRLRWSDQQAPRRLADVLDQHYRMPNVRVCISRQLVERFVPPPQAMAEGVADRILGVPVSGRSYTTTALGVHFVPSNESLQMELRAAGQVCSDTASYAGPAVLYNQCHTRFHIRKLLEFTPRGIRFLPARGLADARTVLRDVQTDYDLLPLVGALVQSHVRDQAAMNRAAAQAETESKVVAKVSRRVDETLDRRLKRLNQRLEQAVLEPLARLDLEPEFVNRFTAPDAMMVRVRLAGNGQLAAHTPRPRTPDGAVADAEIHESAVNNFLRKLDLAGRAFSPESLRAWIREKLDIAEPLNSEMLSQDVRFVFAEDPIRVRFVDGQVQITVSMAELEQGENVWYDLQAHAYYRPDLSGTSAVLLRDGPIELVSDGLSTRGQIAVRGIFSKVFKKNHPWPLWPELLQSEERTADLHLASCVLDDGWLSLVVGSRAKQPAADTTVHRVRPSRPDTSRRVTGSAAR